MDMDMVDLMEAIAETITAAPEPDAPADYLHQRAHIVADAARSVAEGEHPAEVLADMERRLEDAARPVPSTLMMWEPDRVPA